MSNRIYIPDRWVMLKFTLPEGVMYKVLGSWFGGYLGSDSWQLSSGTTGARRNQENKDTLEFPQCSGSTYICGSGSYGTNMYTQSVLDQMLRDVAADPSVGTLEVMDENFDIDIDYQKCYNYSSLG